MSINTPFISTPIILSIALLTFSARLSAENTAITEPSNSEKSSDIFTFKAHFKDLFTWQRTDSYSKTLRKKDLVANLDRVRLSPELNFSDVFIVHVDYDNELVTGNHLGSGEFDLFWRMPYDDYNDLLDLSKEVKYNDDYLYRTKIHRAYAKLALGDFTLTAGRQQVRFGSGRLWNPLDIMNPILPMSLEGSAEQKGTDAIRAEYFFNESTVLSAVADQKRVNDSDRISELDSRNTSGLGRFRTAIGNVEIAALGGRILRRDVGGADVSIIFLDGTLRGSAIRSKAEDADPYVQASAGFEYNFGFGLYFLLEYFYNENGLNFNGELKTAYLSSLAFGINEQNYYMLSNQFVTFNRHYAALALGYDITPLLRAEFFAIYDFQGRAVLINPTLKYNAFQDVDFSLGVMKTWIRGDADYESDFTYLEKYPLAYATFTWYFL